MKLSEKPGVQAIVKCLWDANIRDVVLSPGSRNAPLSLSFEHADGFDIRVIADERVAGYHALGISLYSQRPTVICCTSGTAVLNYAPAIAEAYYQHVPLIVITADRPKEWIDQGDGQTIRQERIFSNYIEKSFAIDGDGDFASAERKMKQAIRAAEKTNGPVHINVSLSEPLYKLAEPEMMWASMAMKPPVFTPPPPIPGKKRLQTSLSETKKILVIAGQMNDGNVLQKELERWSEKKNVVVLTESIANVHSDNFIACIDRTIDGFDEKEKEKFKPDLLITLGGAVVSKKVKAWLRKYQPNQHWKVGLHDLQMDTYQCKSRTIATDEFHFLSAFDFKVESNYSTIWKDLAARRKNSHFGFLSTCPFSDLKAFSILMKSIPSKTILHLGNSSPIRYAQLFDARVDLAYFSNRGVSGIDGCTSTAAGMADVSGQQVTLITGDISFFYDSNAFWNDYLKNLKVIVINNGGGGIFRIIDQPENVKDTELLFETRHTRKAAGIAAAFGIQYLECHDESSLEKAVKQLYANNLPAVLEIFTPTEKNPLILKQYFTHLKNN